MRKTLFVGSLAVCAVMLLASSEALAAENWLGTWKLDVAKSNYTPGSAPKSVTLKFAAASEGFTFTSDGVDAEGKPSHTEFSSKFDGKEVPYKGNPNADTASPRKIDDNSYEGTWRKDGKVTITIHGVVSKDGKTLTIHLKGKNAKAEAVDSTTVYVKQ